MLEDFALARLVRTLVGEVNPVAKEEGRGDEEVFEVFKTIRVFF